MLRWSAFAAVLSGAGLPIYIYAPKLYADAYGVSLTALGLVLVGLRALDVVQDPLLGWLAERLGRARGTVAAIAAALMAAAMIGLLAVPPPGAPLAWFALTLAALFTAYSFLSIAFYAAGVAFAQGCGGHLRLAAWRESGALVGVCLAAAAPALLAAAGLPVALYAYAFAAAALLAAWAMSGAWDAGALSEPVPVGAILADRPARALLLLALVNAAPVAVSSTLFLFFVESRLAAPGWEGALLILFFLSAAAAAPLWSRAAARVGPRRALLAAMALATFSFGWAFLLGPGDAAAFAVICVASGAATGADLTLVPALFAARMARVAPNGGQGFGLWALVSKATLAVSAAALLPALDAAGFVSGEPATGSAARALSALYAALPCALKLIAIGLVLRLPEGAVSGADPEGAQHA